MKEIAVIPKGTDIQIMGCTYTILEDVKVNEYQKHLDDVLKAQNDYQNGIGVVGFGSTSIPLESN
jgi:hypothetical protein